MEPILPAIYDTKIPEQVEQALTNGSSLIVVTAPTGLGKTFFLTRLLATLQVVGHILMPYRIAVKEMWEYVSSSDTEHKYGYRMRGASQGDYKTDDCIMFTVGYWLEYFIGLWKKGQVKKNHIIVVDEAHDTSWQTDLALRFLLWLQKKGAPIQIVISSATLDITESIKQYNPKIFSVENKKANIDIKFLKNPIISIEKGKMSDELKDAIIKKLIDLASSTDVGDIFVMLPGEQEIFDIRTIIEANPLFAEFALHDLYGELSKEEQEEAIQPNPQGWRKIVFTTNIAECAITIKGGVYMIDSCLRKVIMIDHSGISQLVLELTSQANIKQSSGRVGREKKRGTSFIMLSEDQYNRLRPFPSNEVERNPLYHQIMKLLSSELPVFEILSEVSSWRVNNDIDQLVKVGAIKEDRQHVTKIGMIISALPLSLQAGSFLAKVLTSGIHQSYYHITCVIASWIDLSTSIFMNPRRKPKESEDAFHIRRDNIKDAQERFHGTDCLTTFLKVWFASRSEPTETICKWTFKNGIYDKSIKEVFNNVKNCIEALAREGIKVEEYKLTERHIPQISIMMSKCLQMSFSDRIFDRQYDMRSGGYCYFPRNGFHAVKYIKDNATDYYDSPASLLALGLRRAPSGKVIFMSKMIAVESPKLESNSSSDDDSSC